MEDTQRPRDKDAIQHLYNQVLPALATRIHDNLAAVTPLFHDFNLEKVLDTWSKLPDADDQTPISIENGNVQQMGLRLRLEGFQRAGAPPFDITKNLLFKLSHTSYEVIPDKNNVWLEKPYFESWSETETTNIAQQWCEEIIDDITQRLESL